MFPGSPPAFRRWQYVLQTMESWTGPENEASDFSMNLAARTCRRQNGLRRSKEWPSSKPKLLKILTQRYLFVIEICTMMGSHFPRQLGLLVLVRTTSRFFKVHTCTFSLRKSGRAKTRPARPLATAMINANWHVLAVNSKTVLYRWEVWLRQHIW